MDLRCVSKLFIRYHLVKLVLVKRSNSLAATAIQNPAQDANDSHASNCTDGVCSLSDWKPSRV